MSKTILIIDDEKDLAELLAQRLMLKGYKVLSAYDSETGLELIQKNEVHLMISDINLPGKSGLELLNWMSEHFSKIPVVLITGFLNENDAKEAVDKGCFGFLAKPISKQELLRVVENALNPEELIISEIDFARIPLEDFLVGNVVNFPVYIKLAGERFLKVAHTGNEVSMERIQKFKENDVKELWIDKKDLDNYLALCEKLYQATQRKGGLPPHRRINLIKHSTEILYEKIRLTELDPKIINQGIDQLSLMLNQITRYRKLGDMILELQKADKSTYAKAITEAVLCGLVAKALDWTSQTNILNVMIGSFLKDLGINKLPADIQAKEHWSLNENEFEIYKQHPEKSVELIKDIEGINESIIQIVMQHHEDGTTQGYPNQLAFNKLYPPAVLVRMVEQFYEKVFSNLASREKRTKRALIGLIDNMPKNSVELSFCKALMALFKSNTLEDAVDSLAK